MSFRLRNLVVLLFVYMICSAFLKTSSSLTKAGNDHFSEKRYESALEKYREAQIKDPDQPEIQYNLGTSLYELDQFQESEERFKQAVESLTGKEQKAKAWYNYGNAQYRLGDFEMAIESYKNALDLNPDDKDAKYNLEVIQKKKAAFDVKQKEREQEKKDKPPKTEQNKSDQQQKNEQQQGDQKNQDKEQDGDQDKQKGDQDDESEDQNQQKDQEQQKSEQDKTEEEEQDKQENEQKEDQDQQKDQEQQGQIQPQQGQQDIKEDQKGQNMPESKQEQPLLQGQMSKEDALRILDALKTNEQHLQSVLRTPKNIPSRENPERDW